MASIPELTRYIRFQLSQLRPLNKHHAFEDLARQFARLRICENILPATGPVGSGGDQGRDFETYRSYLTSTPIATFTFLGTARNKKIVFACSLQREILTKIKSDVSTICTGINQIDLICYFCEADIPVARRHELQQWARDEFNAELELFDGQALSEQLTSLDVFWIAEEYLDIPAEMYPRVTEEPTTYAAFKRYWLGENRHPYNYADFFQVKYGIRRATFQYDAKPDLRGWMIKMEAFLGEAYPHDLRRRAIYEICVAALRGQNNLTAKKALVEEYFSEINTLHAIADLKDITVLLVYCSSACLYDHLEIEAEKLFHWSKSLIGRIENSLDIAPGSGSQCRLLQIRGYAGLLPFQEDIIPRFSLDDTFEWWFRLVDEVQNAPPVPT
jgi:hypothetical protein